MRRFALALLFGAFSSSCALTLDFDTDRRTNTGGNAQGAGGGGGDGAGGGGPIATQGWVASITAAPNGAAVRLQSVVTVGDATWIGGYYIGESLSLLDAAGSSEELHSGEYAVYSFALGLDALGHKKTFIPIARSAVAEIDTETWAGTLLHPRDGKLVIASTYRDGVTLFDAGTAAEGFGWNLTLLEVDESGSVGWASRCAATVPELEPWASMSARFAGFTTAPDGTTLFGTTIERSSTVTCDTLVGPAGAGDCDAEERLSQSGHLWALAPGGACSSVAPIETLPSVPLWIDSLASTAGGEVLLGARLTAGEVTVEPWGVDVGSALGFGLAGTIAPNGTTASANLQTLPDVTSTLLVGADEYFAGSMTNMSGALDMIIGKRGSPPLLFGSENELRNESVTSLSVDGGGLLVTGWMSDGSDLTADLCGAGCQGDLGTVSAETCASDVVENDAFWILIDASTTPALAPGMPAVGRTVGGCLNQRIVDAQLSSNAMTLLFEIEGETSIDLLDGDAVTVTPPVQTKAGVVARLPRPVTGN